MFTKTKLFCLRNEKTPILGYRQNRGCPTKKRSRTSAKSDCESFSLPCTQRCLLFSESQLWLRAWNIRRDSSDDSLFRLQHGFRASSDDKHALGRVENRRSRRLFYLQVFSEI